MLHNSKRRTLFYAAARPTPLAFSALHMITGLQNVYALTTNLKIQEHTRTQRNKRTNEKYGIQSYIKYLK